MQGVFEKAKSQFLKGFSSVLKYVPLWALLRATPLADWSLFVNIDTDRKWCRGRKLWGPRQIGRSPSAPRTSRTRLQLLAEFPADVSDDLSSCSSNFSLPFLCFWWIAFGLQRCSLSWVVHTSCNWCNHPTLIYILQVKVQPVTNSFHWLREQKC